MPLRIDNLSKLILHTDHPSHRPTLVITQHHYKWLWMYHQKSGLWLNITIFRNGTPHYITKETVYQMSVSSTDGIRFPIGHIWLPTHQLTPESIKNQLDGFVV